MSKTATLSVNNILNRVAVEVGLDAVTDPYGSTTQHFVQMKNLLQVAGEELCLLYPWEFLVVKKEITTTTDNAIALPDDFQSIIPQSGWNETTEEPIIGPLSAQEWQAIQATNNQNLIRYAFRIFDGKFNIYPDPPAAGIALSYEYQSLGFVRAEGSPDTPMDTITAGSDIIIFDRTLITRHLKLLWLEAKGFDTTGALAAFNQTFNNLTGKDKSARILDAGGRYTGVHLLDGHNLPITGLGS